MPATLEGIMADARTYMRDHPRFFAAASAMNNVTKTYDTNHANVLLQQLEVTATNGTTVANGTLHHPDFAASATDFSYYVDEREGLIRIATPRTGGFGDGWYLNVEGYYAEWTSDIDLRFHANNVIGEHAFERDGFDFDRVPDAEADVMAIGTAVGALVSIMAETARDIDTNTPEAISLPLTQRFRQLQQLLFGEGGLYGRYAHKAQMLGVGLDRVMVGTLRRVSRTTNRLVPVYRPLEYDDARRPTRVFPRTDQMAPTYPPSDFVPARHVTYNTNGEVVIEEIV